MTSIKYTQDERHIRISIHGHAGFTLDGNDPVCSGISSITCMVINWLGKYDGKYITALNMEVISGNVTLDFWALALNIWEVFWDGALIGFEAIAQMYPENLSIEGASVSEETLT